jgi:hypothetical protein
MVDPPRGCCSTRAVRVPEVTADCLLDHLSIARPVDDDRAGILELTERKERKPARELRPAFAPR